MLVTFFKHFNYIEPLASSVQHCFISSKLCLIVFRNVLFKMNVIVTVFNENQTIFLLQSRSITFYTKDVDEEQDKQEYQASTELFLFSRSPRSGKVTLDENNEFHWPLYLLYPEFNQSDFVEDCHEDVRYSFI